MSESSRNPHSRARRRRVSWLSVQCTDEVRIADDIPRSGMRNNRICSGPYTQCVCSKAPTAHMSYRVIAVDSSLSLPERCSALSAKWIGSEPRVVRSSCCHPYRPFASRRIWFTPTSSRTLRRSQDAARLRHGCPDVDLVGLHRPSERTWAAAMDDLSGRVLCDAQGASRLSFRLEMRLMPRDCR